MGQVWAPVLLLVLVAASTAGCVDDAAPTSDADGADLAIEGDVVVGSWIQNATWYAQWEGDLVVRLGVRSAEATDCRWQWGLWGVSSHLHPTSGDFVSGHQETPALSVGRGQGNFDIQAHASATGAVEAQPIEAEYPWADGKNWTYDMPAGRSVNFTFFGVGLSPDAERTPSADRFVPVEDERVNVFMQLACAHPVEVVTLGAGSEVVVFNEAALRGGASAHVYARFDPTGAAVASRAAKDVTSAHGLLALRVLGDVLGNHVAAGVIETTYPGGGDVLIDHPSQYIAACGLQSPACPVAREHHEGGPGVYAVEATYASVDVLGVLEGALAGFDPVERLPLERMVEALPAPE